MIRILTQHGKDLGLPFAFKVLDRPTLYQRLDSGVLRSQKSDYAIVQPRLQTIYASHGDHFQETTPLFAQGLAPGLAVPEVPGPDLHIQSDFGPHRCHFVAQGLLEAEQHGKASAADRT